jgi:hypothetical protein
LESKNQTYNNRKDYKKILETIGEQLGALETEILRELQTIINIKMDSINNEIYNGEKKSPIITLEENTYKFNTPDDTGTGTAYRGLVIFDMSILMLTSLPVLVHDSVVFKQIADEALHTILELYQKSGKQVFIALDKADSYKIGNTSKILEETAVLHLSNNGKELFGRSWSNKSDKEATHD